MKKVVMTVVGVLALAASANAQLLGTWYTDQTEWLKYATVVDTASYTTGSIPQNGITSFASGGVFTYEGLLTTNASSPITFTFSGNAFAGYFGMVNDVSAYVQRNITFSIDESLTEVHTLTSTSAGANTFLGYISNSASDISSVKVTGNNSDYVAVNSFSRANGTNPLGASVAPEPGTLALALTGGCALLGMFIRRRKTA